MWPFRELQQWELSCPQFQGSRSGKGLGAEALTPSLLFSQPFWRLGGGEEAVALEDTELA